MTTGWLLLVVMVVFYQNVDAHAWTDAKVYDGKLPSKLKRHVDMKSDQRRIPKNRQVDRDVETQYATLQELKTSHQEMLEQLQNRVQHQATEFVAETQHFHDCTAMYDFSQRSNGVYTIYVGSTQRAIEVSCDMTTDGGGWTVFQRRRDGSENFYRNWTDYATGFGNLNGEFWLGNDNLHLLTSGECQQLRVDLGDFEEDTAYAKYDNFTVGSAAEKYELISLGTYTGNAGDSLTYHVGQKFSTRDQDNDSWNGRHCSVLSKGAWWYNGCYYSNLNGLYLGGANTAHGQGVNWYHWKGRTYSLRFTEMKIRPCQH